MLPLGVPTSLKKTSCPGGVHMQSSRAASLEPFPKACCALAGTLTFFAGLRHEMFVVER